jgi:hypothetical protein
MDPSRDFHHTVLPVLIGFDASRDIADVHLSRIGFLLAVQSADPAKSMVVLGKAYIAEQMLRSTGSGFTLRPVEKRAMPPRLSYRARQKLRRGGPISQAAANKVHHDIGAAVRQFTLDQGGTPPELLPTPAESIKQLERNEQQCIQAEQQPSLFGPGELPTEDPTDDEG